MKRAGEGRDVLQAVSLGQQGWAEGRMQGGVGGEEEGEELREDGLKRKPYTTRDEKGSVRWISSAQTDISITGMCRVTVPAILGRNQIPLRVAASISQRRRLGTRVSMFTAGTTL